MSQRVGVKLSSGGRPRKTSNRREPDSGVTTLRQLGITKKQSSNWQWIAHIPRPEFEFLVESDPIPSEAALVRYSKWRATFESTENPATLYSRFLELDKRVITA